MKGIGIQESQDIKGGFLNEAFRSIAMHIDMIPFWLLTLMYQIFFNVATADLFNSEIILDFYKRFQLIIGVFMIFQLALLILRGIMDPDQVTDKKSGAGTFIKRVIISLTLLTVLTPISIPDADTKYEKQLNNNGLLFGTLYSLQDRILENNTLGRLILGSNTGGSTSSTTEESGVESTDKTQEDLKEAADVFAATILKGFIRINLRPNWEEHYKVEDEKNPKPPETQNKCRMCQDISDEDLATYTRLDADPQKVLALVNNRCEPDIDWGSKGGSKKRFAFTYRPFICGIVALVFAVILLSFTIDVVIRGVKLVILRLLAPIPIISYMDPKGGKDSAFNAWGKLLISTYLDLFIRLSIVYFALALIQDIIKKGIGMDAGGGIIMVLSYILIFLGIFAFAKEAPKFIREMLGMKGDGGRLFSGLGTIMAGAGAIGTANAARIASRNSDITRDLMHGTNKADRWINKGKHLVAGIAGGFTGLAAGTAAANGAKGMGIKETMEAQHKQAVREVTRGGSGSTLWGRTKATAAQTFLGDTPYEQERRNIELLKAREKAAKDLYSYAEGKGKTDFADKSVITEHANGKQLFGSYDDFKKLKNEAAAKYARGDGDGTFTFGSYNKETGQTITETFDINKAYTEKFEGLLAESAGTAWMVSEQEKGKDKMDPGLFQKLTTYYETAPEKDSKPQQRIQEEKNGAITGNLTNLKKSYKAVGGQAIYKEQAGTFQEQKANYQANDKK